ncbi:MAG: hypothetical protein WCB51_03180 [Candidatus Dormiibacterota bacterium]
MNEEAQTRRVEITFVGRPPARQIALASGVSEVEVDGFRVRCLVIGSVQPFLEALHGYEVIGLTSSPALSVDDEQDPSAHGEQSAGDGGGG